MTYIKYCKTIIAVTLLWLLPVYEASAHNHPTDYERTWGKNFSLDVRNDFLNYFENNRLVLFGDAILIGGVLANTGLDRAFGQSWQDNSRNRIVDRTLKFPEAIGSLSYLYAPLFIASMGIGHMREETVIGNVLYHWGYRSLRTFILGGLQQAALTNLLGGGRPCNNQDSKWQPFQYQTGVSGHAFYGAVPILTAAMMTDPPLIKGMLYVFSVLPGFARINTNKHYLSQVFLGWSLAYLSASTIYDTDASRNPTFQMNILPKADGAMLSAKLNF